MASRHSSLSEQRRRNLNERQFWQSAYLEALGTLLLKHDGRMGPEGTAQLAGQHADAALTEYKRRRSSR